MGGYFIYLIKNNVYHKPISSVFILLLLNIILKEEKTYKTH